MAIRLLVSTLLLLLPVIAHAQVSQVLSGDHAGFTRVAFYMTPGTEWSVAQNGRRVALEFPQQARRPNLARAFERITRERLAALIVNPDTGRIELALACDCTAEAYQYLPNLMLVDIRDGGLPPDIAAQTDPVDRSPLPSILGLTRAPSSVLFPDTPAASALDAEIAAAQPEPERADDKTEPKDNRFAAMVRQSAEQGVLKFEVSPVEAPDPVPQAAVTGEAPAPAGLDCEPSRLFTLEDEGTAPELLSRLSQARQAVVTEAGDTDGPAIRTLARIYLSASFGAEALAALSDDPSPEAEAMKAMAAVIEGHGAAGFAGIDAETCSDAAYVWAVLAQASEQPEGGLEDRDDKRLLRSFDLLPDPLKTYLAPDLAGRAIDSGKQELAELLVIRAGRLGPAGQEAMRLSAARLNIRHGDDATGIDAMIDLAASASPQAPDALHRLFTEAEPDPGQAQVLAELAEISRVEHRGAEDFDKFIATEFRALIASGDLDAAARILSSEGLSDTGLAARLAPEFTQALSKIDDIETLVRLTHTSEFDPLIGGGPEPLLAVAGRLLEQGFADKARDLLERTGDITSDVRNRKALLLARSHLQQGDPVAALDALGSDIGEEAVRVRAEARLALQDYAGAATDFSDAAQPGMSAYASFLGEDWQAASEASDFGLAPLAALARDGAPAVDAGDPGSLEEYRALLNSAQETRQLINDALARSSDPADPDAVAREN